MTREEAIKLLKGRYLYGYNERINKAVQALCAQPVKLDRSRWEGCSYCKGDLEGYTSCFKDENGRSRSIYIPEGKAAIVIPGKYNHKSVIKIAYCPFCGRPLTEKAWAELERRIGGNDGKTDNDDAEGRSTEDGKYISE